MADNSTARALTAAVSDLLELRREVLALRAALDRRAAATAELLAVVRAVAAWEEGTGRADLLEALEEYGRALAEELPPLERTIDAVGGGAT